MAAIFVVTFPFFALVLGGYVAIRWRLLPIEAIPGLNVFVLMFALPCMLYKFASMTPIVRLLDPGIVLTYLIAAALMVALTMLAGRRGRTGWTDAAFGALVGSFPNSGFMGVPLLVALLGAAAAGPAIVALAVDMVFTSSLCIALSQLGAAGEHGARRAALQGLKGMLKNPLPWSIFLGCLSTASGKQLPAPLFNAVDMLAGAASPAALFTIGAVLARTQALTRRRTGSADHRAVAPIRNPRVDTLQLVAFKVIAHPAIVLALGSLAMALGAPLERTSLVVLVLIAALPSASNVPMLAERFGADAGRIAAVVLSTTVVAFLTFPLAVALMK
ncbi:AEC family transporter [Variovorax sp. J22R133]|uniref:AEC family transporter n=1 Tax=Variovorax brevis TaxID=3053503 RepID=UPI00257576D1|nr:AEC family transporter [Variovorax sp. J22R133]MDM0117780.1 AEC family transporter [Variovorax sp. J22R133]